MERKRPGRKPGRYKVYDRQKLVRMQQEDVKRLAALATRLGVSEAAVIRQAIRELARREGLE